MDRWKSKAVIVSSGGGLVLSEDALTQGTSLTGTARQLINYEPSLEGGYSKLLGFDEFDDEAVPGEGSVLGVKVCFDGVVAARAEDVYYSTGAGWTMINSSPRTGSGEEKYRFIYYTLSTPVLVLCDGTNYAAKWDGDSTYTLINGTGAPADPKYAAVYISRLILSGYSSNPRAISISVANNDTSFDGASGAAEIVVGDVVVGLKLFRNTLYIFCENSIRKLTGTASDNFAIEPVTSSIGCVSGDTIQEVGGDLIYLAPDGFRSLAATEKIGDVDLALQSKAIQPLVRSFVGSYTSDSFSSCVIRKKSQYRTFIFNEDSLSPTARYGNTSTAIYGSSIYGLQSDDGRAEGILGKLGYGENGGASYEWGQMLGINAFSCDSEYINDDEVVVFGHPANGKVYRLESGYSFGGEPISYTYQSPYLTFDDATLRKVLQKITLYTEIEGIISFTLAVKYDFETTGVLQPNPISFTLSGNISLYGTAIYGTDTYSAGNSPVLKKNLVGSGFTASFLISGNDTDPTHRIDGYQVEYSEKGRR